MLERDKEAAPLKTVILATTVNEEEGLQFDEVDDKKTIPPSAVDDSELPTIEASVDEVPTDQMQTEATVEVGEVVSGEERKTSLASCSFYMFLVMFFSDILLLL